MKTIRIGRDATNDIIVESYSVSRFHSEIHIDNYGSILYVDHSTNGTIINGYMVHNSQCTLQGYETIYLAGEVAIPIQDLIGDSRSRATMITQSTPYAPSNSNYGNPGNTNGNATYGVNPPMGFGKTLGYFFQHYTDFSGRARRTEYWYMVLWNLIFGIIPIINILWALAVIIPFIALAVRRLHDIGRSGVWYLICLIPLVGSIILLIWLLTDSEQQPNKWGKSPKYNL